MKKTNKISKWCKRTLMLLPVLAVLTFMSCQKDELLPETATDTGASLHAASLARASAAGTYVIDFESAKGYLAGPTSYGENLYEDYADTIPEYPRYYYYYDAATELYMKINPTGKWSPDPNFFNGGIAISQWNDMVMPGDSNQCSVYYDDGYGNGGYDGSKTFAVHYGYNEPTYMGDTRSYITFDNPDKTCVFNSFYVCNSTYAALAMLYGYYVGRPLDYDHKDWFKLIAEGIKPDGTSSGTVEFYLADFRTLSSPGVILGWSYVDLSPLGKVTAIRFDMQGSDSGDYGLNTPAYFCFDNLSVTISD